MIYWDSSVILKLYVAESDSDRWQQLMLREARPLISSALVQTEIACALRHKAYGGKIPHEAVGTLLEMFHSDISAGRIQVIPIGSDVLAESVAMTQASQLVGIPLLRSLGSIHLATARVLKCKVIATADLRMAEVAQAFGLEVASALG